MSLQENISSPRRGRRQKKVPVFESLNEHATRDFRLIDKNALTVPVLDYQRNESEGRIAAEIAMHFDIVSFGALLVIERADGSLVVADGGTRLAGACQRNDIVEVPCVVFAGLTAKEEGDVFLRVNCNRRKLQTDQQHHAELYSDHDLAKHAQRLLDHLAHYRVGFDSLSTMRYCVRTNLEVSQTVVGLLVTVGIDKHVSARVMKAMFRLETVLNKNDRTLNRRPIVNRMQGVFHSFEHVVNSQVGPRQGGNTVDMARALARTLKIKYPATIKE
jgi:hypothetical protein